MINIGTVNKYDVFLVKPTGDYRAVMFKREKTKLELRVAGTAIANQPCGLSEKLIHKWLMEKGRSILEDMGTLENVIVLLTSYDIKGGEIITNWRNRIIQ